MIYVIIPVHNRKQFTLDCLAYLAQQTFVDYQLIIVDDGSTDGTSELIRQQFPHVLILTGDGHLWWTGAINMGIRYVFEQLSPTSTDFILTLNDDIRIKPDYLANLISSYHHNAPCLVGSVSVDVKDPHKLLYAGTGLNVYIPHIDNWADSRFNNSYETLASQQSYVLSDTLPGRGLLIPTIVFDKIGLFDEHRFRHHMADLDFSARARKAGFPLLVSVGSVVYEYADATGLDVSKPMSFRQFIQALSSIKSPINRRVRYHFALKHSPFSYLYFFMDMLQISGGYIRRQLKHHRCFTKHLLPH